MMQDEEFRGVLDNFTYYPDTLSVYPLTMNSIPNILTGTINCCKLSYEDYCNNAYNNSIIFEKLEQNGYDINLYVADSISWSGNKKFDIKNTISIYDAKINFYNFMTQEIKYIEFKYLPYGVKQLSQIQTLDFNECKMFNSEHPGYSRANEYVYNYIKNTDILNKQDKNYFQFIHCDGGHDPFTMDKYLNYIEEGTYDQEVAASLTMIKAYLQRLKDNGVYDNSTVVIMADHGQNTDGYTEQPALYLDRCNPILFIKGFNEHHELLKSDQPVSYMDLQDAFCDLIDGKQSTELFEELTPNRTRKIMWYMWSNIYHMVEYETTGKAWEVEKFTPTGNVYDLKE